ncbi:MAG: hypothetical protein EOO61_08245 [Hymenobacter sp.]|nr:MAG: hypothetical protein EOO61_08245 [Hymenobacter sp.]
MWKWAFVGQVLPQRAGVLFAAPSQSENVCVKDEALKVVAHEFLSHQYLRPFVKTPCLSDQCGDVEFDALPPKTYRNPRHFLDKVHGALGKMHEASLL